jgi:hypothetical protein
MGTKAKWVNRRLTLYNGPVEFSTGAYIVDENVYTSTAVETIKGYGLTVVNTTHVRTLPAPEDGSVVEVLFYGTTKAMTLTAGSGAYINGSTLNDSIAVTLTSADAAEIGKYVKFRGSSTSNWWMMTQPDLNPTVSFTSST